MRALILMAHGSRDPAWADPLRELTRRVAARRAAAWQAAEPAAAGTGAADRAGGGPVVLAFLELAEPLVEQAVDDVVTAGADHVAVIPVFLGAGRHLKADLPPRLDAVRARHPGVTVVQHPPIGESGEILDALADALVGLAGDEPDPAG